MATLLLAAAGGALGGVFGSAAALVGQAIGGIAGYVVDRTLIRSTLPGVSGPRLSDLDVSSSTEGDDVPRVYGRARLAGQLIWATRHEESATKSGGKGGPKVKTWHYHANFAVALCEGPIHHVGRIWADGTLLDTSALTVRVHLGGEDQEPDALILAKQGGAAPAYRGIAHVVFEHFPLDDWGNRIPQLSFEVIRVVDRLEEKVRAVTIIPGGTEFGYATTAVTRSVAPGVTESENRHVRHAATDFVAALDELCGLCPNLKRIALVVTWFGDDLRAGHCRVEPRVEQASKTTRPLVWSVAGLEREVATLVSAIDGRPAYGGTPADAAVVEAITEIRSRGIEVMLYPFLSMDIPAGNGLPDPHGGIEQPAHPWRGRITCHPAPGTPGSPDGTAAAAAEIAAFVGTAAPGDFTVADGGVAYSGPAEWSWRRMILHYATLANVAGGVEALLIGSEFVGLNAVRGEGGSHPFVAALVDLVADVRAVVGPSTKLSYAADWSEWNGHHPTDGSGDVIFHLDPLWASPHVDFVGIDAYFPLTDWRPGDYLDQDLADLPTDRAHLDARITGGEAYDWYYADEAGRRAQIRLPITDGARAEPWVFRRKDLAGWWSNLYFDRPGGVAVASPTAWVAGMKPIRFTELGCPAVDLGSNQPNVFPDPKSSESRRPWFSIGSRDDLVQRRTLEVVLDHWNAEIDPGAVPPSPLDGTPMIAPEGIHLWTWDARPFPAFPVETEVWSDGDDWATGHWLNGRLGGTSLEGLIAAILADHGIEAPDFRAVAGHVDGYVVDRRMSAREALEPLLAAFGIDAHDTGTGLRFAGRARRCDAELPVEDCVEVEKGANVTLRRAQESELPGEVSVTFSDAALDHRRATVASRRLEDGVRRTASADLAVVAPVETMIGVADAWLADTWAGRTTANFAVDPTKIALEPGDLVDLVVDGRAERLSIESLTDGPARRIEARSHDSALRGPVRAVPRRRSGSPATVWGAPAAVVLDLAHPQEDAVLHRPWLAAFAIPWPGALGLWRRLDEGGWTVVGTIDRPATLGVTASSLRRGPVASWDRFTTLDVTLWRGTLAAESETRVLAGAGRVAVRAPDGRWEVLQHAGAEMIGPSTWRLSTLLRCQGGSEDVWDDVAEIAAGATFVVLDDDLPTLPVGIEDVGGEAVFRIGPASEDYSRPSHTEFTVTPTARGLMSWAPAHLRAATDPATGDVHVSWVRRARGPGADAWGAGEIPLPEGTEAHRLEFRVGATTVFVVDTTAPSYVWPAAERDAGLGPDPVDVTVRVAQLSAIVGPGMWRSGVFHL
ncbi:MAG: glycoside hydrolase/phage tail family protein [Siculibacillus sp.]|nr:glycoside hydrolase/phage tail family protein [Siculibacillus sp.]